MFWADSIIDTIEERFRKKIESGEPLVVRDEKTLSGRVHVGSLRGIVLHGLLSQILDERKIANKCLFELNDADPMDGLPVYIDEKEFAQHMGKPLFTVPPVDPQYKNFPVGFGEELQGVVDPMGLPIEWYYLRPYYEDGSFNETIQLALENAPAIRNIYKEVSGGGKPDDWFPLNVICPECGKIGTTKVTGWDGKEVTYECKKDHVTWAEGCGKCGTMDPFDGRATLPWKVEWAAKWKVIGVDIEAAGKDHYAAGGSREIAARISEEVFNYPEPYGFLYEWLNIKGRSMSSSGGVGASAKEIADLLPPNILKFLMIRKEQNQPIDFDPEGRTVPNLFDEYDRCKEHYFKRVDEPFDGFARAFALAQTDVSKDPQDLWEMRFQALSFVVQMPHLTVEEEAEKLKGSALTAAEKEALSVRADYVQKWIEHLAPEEFKYVIQEEVPADLELSDAQKEAITKLATDLEALSEWTGEAVHGTIHRTKEHFELKPKEIFQPLYSIFLGRTSGPQVGWFISTLQKDTVLSMLQAATTAQSNTTSSTQSAMNMDLPDETAKRYIAIINKKVEPGRQMNALGHMANGLSALASKTEDLCFLEYEDADGGVHPSISHYPFVVLKADNSNKIRTVREEALKRGIPFTDFTSSMTVGTSQEQLVKTKEIKEEDLEYYGICMFGDTEVLKEFTKKFSLFN